MSDTLEEIYYMSGEEPKPDTNPNHLRVYGHMLCPFVQRGYLALGAKDIEFQKCSIDLLNKAKWHVDFNGGLIPVLETPAGDMINESAVVQGFAVDFAPKDQGLKLWPHEAAEPGNVQASVKTG